MSKPAKKTQLSFETLEDRANPSSYVDGSGNLVIAGTCSDRDGCGGPTPHAYRERGSPELPTRPNDDARDVGGLPGPR